MARQDWEPGVAPGAVSQQQAPAAGSSPWRGRPGSRLCDEGRGKVTC